MNNNNKNLNPNFVTGFAGAESCIHVSIVDKAELKAGKSVRVLFQISLHKKDKALLDQIKQFFCQRLPRPRGRCVKLDIEKMVSFIIKFMKLKI